jgi:hypothetical protein
VRGAVVAAALCLAAAGCGGGETTGSAGRAGSEPPAASGGGGQAPRADASPATPAAGETLAARLVRDTALHATPGGEVVTRLATRTQFRSRHVLAVVARQEGWLGVLSPALPDGRTGWIRSGDARLLRETWSIDVDLSQRELLLRHRGRPYRRMTVGVGKRGTPTPTGVYGVTDRLRTGTSSSTYGCCVLALSGRQPNVPQAWAGGDRLAIHGTNDPSTIGARASLGCVHARERDLRLLMAHVPLGAQVRIHA